MVNILADAIAQARIRRGWNQTELAERAETTRHTVGNIERGRDRAEIGIVLRLIEALGLEVTVTERPTFDSPDDYLEHLSSAPAATRGFDGA